MAFATSKKNGEYVRFWILTLACVNLIVDAIWAKDFVFEIMEKQTINNVQSTHGNNTPNIYMERFDHLRKLFLEKIYYTTVLLFIVNILSLIFTLMLIVGLHLKKSSIVVTYLLFATNLTAVYLILVTLSYYRLTKFNDLEIYKEQAFICMRIAFKLVALMFLVLMITWGYCIHGLDIEEPVETETSIDTSRVDPEIAPIPPPAAPLNYINGPQVPSAPLPHPYMPVYYHHYGQPQEMNGHYSMDQTSQVEVHN